MNDDNKKFKDTKVGKWLSEKAPDILETVSDVTPDGGILDAVAGIIRGKEDMDPATKLEFERMYIAERIEDQVGTVSRIARGIPVGGDLEYADEVTLVRALQGRHQLDGATRR